MLPRQSTNLFATVHKKPYIAHMISVDFIDKYNMRPHDMYSVFYNAFKENLDMKSDEVFERLDDLKSVYESKDDTAKVEDIRRMIKKLKENKAK